MDPSFHDQADYLQWLARQVSTPQDAYDAQQRAQLEAMITPPGWGARVPSFDVPSATAGVGAYAPTTILGNGVVTTAALSDGAVTGPKIAAAAVAWEKFASGILPPRVVTSLPSLPDSVYPQGSLVFLTTDMKIYRNTDGSTWSVAVDGADILANSITAGQIAAGAIGADELAATIVLASLIKTANTGCRVEIDTNGIRAIDSSNNLMVNIPTDGSPVYVYGQVQASSLNVLGNATLRGTANELTKGSVTNLGNSTGNPTAAPVLTQGWDTVSVPTSSPGWMHSMAYDAAGGAGGATKVFWAVAMSGSDWYIGEYLASDRTLNRSKLTPANTDYVYGVARHGNYVYAVLTISGAYRVCRWLASDLTLDATYASVSWPAATPLNPTISSDGTNIFIADTDSAGSYHLVWNVYNSSMVKQGSTVDTGYVANNAFYDCYAGTADYGAWRMVGAEPLMSRTTVFDSTGARQANDEFPLLWSVYSGVTYGDALGDGARFWSIAAGPTVLYKHTTWNWTTASSIYWVAYSWYDSVVTTHETQCGPRASITMGKRKYLSATCAPVPTGGGDDPNNHRLYMLPNATDPGLTNLKLQDTFATDSTTLRTYASGGAADPASNTFGAGTPAELKSSVTGWSLKGNGIASLGTVQGGGASFPASPTTADRYWRSDLNMEFLWNGTRLALDGPLLGTPRRRAGHEPPPVHGVPGRGVPHRPSAAHPRGHRPLDREARLSVLRGHGRNGARRFPQVGRRVQCQEDGRHERPARDHQHRLGRLGCLARHHDHGQCPRRQRDHALQLQHEMDQDGHAGQPLRRRVLHLPRRDDVMAIAVGPARSADAMTTVELLQAGRLEQTCPTCGRCESAGAYCSWCTRPMGETDWYLPGRGRGQHEARLPAIAPADPPTEYRHAYQPRDGTGWPPAWGPNPYQKPPRASERVGARLQRPSSAPSASDASPTAAGSVHAPALSAATRPRPPAAAAWVATWNGTFGCFLRQRAIV